MKVKEIIAAMGGRPYVQRLCGVGKAQLSKFHTLPYIPVHHIKLFIALRPELDWNDLLHSHTLPYISVLTDKGVRDVRYARLRRIKNTADLNKLTDEKEPATL